MPHKPKLLPKVKPPPTSAPLLSPKIWMAEDFDTELCTIPRMRAILDFAQITDSYGRKFQQIAVFETKLLPRIKTLIERHGGDISSIDDAILLKEILMIPKIIEKKRRASSPESGDLTSSNHFNNPAYPSVVSRVTVTNKRIKSSR
ncbi:hypothetical protein PSTG_04858 [Puccinia striiformis f. sp. tritici PST-78]|uniref:Uncharacterized protein n=1 Tax=Puccinia striiformis f. sp. tritici PST-78 TaxID=1165861 RepID=A0A0L0VRY1_9BASI|nr:hypothetical protein PSTG_04858 [Puccinia striiformis f. sp. tritici PST-78]